jgi:hypothetical protein
VRAKEVSYRGSNSKLLVVIGTDCTGSYNSNYHTNTTTTAPVCNLQCQHFIWFISKSSAIGDTILTFLFLFYYFICIDTQIYKIKKTMQNKDLPERIVLQYFDWLVLTPTLNISVIVWLSVSLTDGDFSEMKYTHTHKYCLLFSWIVFHWIVCMANASTKWVIVINAKW